MSLHSALCRSSRLRVSNRLPFSCFSVRWVVPINWFNWTDTRPVFLGLKPILPESIAFFMLSKILAKYSPDDLDRKLLYGDLTNADNASRSSDPSGNSPRCARSASLRRGL